MFLRHKVRRKDGKEHRYWSIVEKRRVAGGRTVQRHVLHLGEINDNQRAAWYQAGCSGSVCPITTARCCAVVRFMTVKEKVLHGRTDQRQSNRRSGGEISD